MIKMLGHYRVGRQPGNRGVGEVCVANDPNIGHSISLQVCWHLAVNSEAFANR
jgi:hypothetical protein